MYVAELIYPVVCNVEGSKKTAGIICDLPAASVQKMRPALFFFGVSTIGVMFGRASFRQGRAVASRSDRSRRGGSVRSSPYIGAVVPRPILSKKEVCVNESPPISDPNSAYVVDPVERIRSIGVIQVLAFSSWV